MSHGIGYRSVTKRTIECFNSSFDISTKVIVINVTDHGYDLEDESGNQIPDTGWDSIE